MRSISRRGSSVRRRNGSGTVLSVFWIILCVSPMQGRLDKDSRGLLLMTNNGDIINRMMRAANRHEKEYKVTVDREITEDFVRQMSEGVPILDTVTRPCKVEKIGKYTFSIVLTQGLNRQIRRMCEALGYEGAGSGARADHEHPAGKPEGGTVQEADRRRAEELYEEIKDSPAESAVRQTDRKAVDIGRQRSGKKKTCRSGRQDDDKTENRPQTGWNGCGSWWIF